MHKSANMDTIVRSISMSPLTTRALPQLNDLDKKHPSAICGNIIRKIRKRKGLEDLCLNSAKPESQIIVERKYKACILCSELKIDSDSKRLGCSDCREKLLNLLKEADNSHYLFCICPKNCENSPCTSCQLAKFKEKELFHFRVHKAKFPHPLLAVLDKIDLKNERLAFRAKLYRANEYFKYLCENTSSNSNIPSYSSNPLESLWITQDLSGTLCSICITSENKKTFKVIDVLKKPSPSCILCLDCLKVVHSLLLIDTNPILSCSNHPETDKTCSKCLLSKMMSLLSSPMFDSIPNVPQIFGYPLLINVETEKKIPNDFYERKFARTTCKICLLEEDNNSCFNLYGNITVCENCIVSFRSTLISNMVQNLRRRFHSYEAPSNEVDSQLIIDTACLSIVFETPCNSHIENVPLWKMCPGCFVRKCIRLIPLNDIFIKAPLWLRRLARRIIHSKHYERRRENILYLHLNPMFRKHSINRSSSKPKVSKKVTYFTVEEESLSPSKLEGIMTSFEFLYRPDGDNSFEEEKNLSLVFTTDYTTDTCSESEAESKDIPIDRKSNVDEIASQPSPSVDSMKSDDGSSLLMEETRSKRQRKMTSRLLDYLSDKGRQTAGPSNSSHGRHSIASPSSEASGKSFEPPQKIVKNKRISESIHPEPLVEKKQPRVKQPLTQPKQSLKTNSSGQKKSLEESQEDILTTMVKAAQMAAVSVKVPNAPSPETAASKALKGYYQKKSSNSKKSRLSLSLLDDESSEMENLPEIDSDENTMLHDDMIVGSDGSVLPKRCGQCPPCKGLVKPCFKCQNCQLDPTDKKPNCIRLVCYRRKSSTKQRKNGPRVKMPTVCSNVTGKPRVLQSSQLHNQPVVNTHRPVVSLVQTVEGLSDILKDDEWQESISNERSAPTESAKGTIFGSSNKIVSSRLHAHAPDPTKKTKTIPGGDLNLLHGGRYEHKDSLSVTSNVKVRQLDGEFIDNRLAIQGGFPIVSTSKGVPPKEICYSCGSGGGQLLFCRTCAEPFHFYCIDRQFRPAKKDQFTCQNCCSCSVCFKPTVELKCLTCSKYYHQRCMKNYPPTYAEKIPSFFCPDCTICDHCRCKPKDTSVYEMRVGIPVSSLNTNNTQINGLEDNSLSRLVPWSIECNKCALCYDSQSKGSVCPECDRVYTDETTQMFQCDHCDLWIHRSCAKFTYDQYNLIVGLPPTELAKFKLLCSICRKETSISGEVATTSLSDGLKTEAHVESDNDLLRDHVQAELKKKITTFINYCTNAESDRDPKYDPIQQYDGTMDEMDTNYYTVDMDETVYHDIEDEFDLGDMEGIEIMRPSNNINNGNINRSRKQSFQELPTSSYETPQHSRLNVAQSKKRPRSKSGYPPCPVSVNWLLLPEELQIAVTSKFIVIPPLVRVMYRLDVSRNNDPYIINNYRKLLKWLLGLIEYLFPWLPIPQIISEIKEGMLNAKSNMNKILTSLFNNNKLELFETACPIVSRYLEMVTNCLATNSLTYQEKSKYIHSAIDHLEQKHGKLVKKINSLLCPGDIQGRERNILLSELIKLLHKTKSCHRLNSLLQEKAKELSQQDDSWIEHYSKNEEEIATKRFQANLAHLWKRQLEYHLKEKKDSPRELPGPAYLSIIWEDFTEKLNAIKKVIQHRKLTDPNLDTLFDELLKDIAEFKDKRSCLFCGHNGDESIEGRLIYTGCDTWIHVNCALWSNEVYEDANGCLAGLSKAIRRAAITQCSDCGKYGATLTCSNPLMSCPTNNTAANSPLTCVHFVCSLIRSHPFPKPIFTSDRSWFCSPACHEITKNHKTISRLDAIRKKRFLSHNVAEALVSFGKKVTDAVISENDIKFVEEAVSNHLMPLFFGALMVCRRVFVPSNCIIQALKSSNTEESMVPLRYKEGFEAINSRSRITMAILSNLFVSSRTLELASTRGITSSDLIITIGALRIDSIGSLKEASDSQGSTKTKRGYLCPIGYRAKRFYWSHLNPDKRAVYTLQISQIHSPNPPESNEIEQSENIKSLRFIEKPEASLISIPTPDSLSNIGFKRSRPKPSVIPLQNKADAQIIKSSNRLSSILYPNIPIKNGHMDMASNYLYPKPTPSQVNPGMANTHFVPQKTIYQRVISNPINNSHVITNQTSQLNPVAMNPPTFLSNSNSSTLNNPTNNTNNIIRIQSLPKNNVMVIKQINQSKPMVPRTSNVILKPLPSNTQPLIPINHKHIIIKNEVKQSNIISIKRSNIPQFDGTVDVADENDAPFRMPRNRLGSSSLDILATSTKMSAKEHLVQQELVDRISRAKNANYERIIQEEIFKDSSNYALQFSISGIIKNAPTATLAWKEILNKVSVLRQNNNQNAIITQVNGWSQFGLNHRHVVFLIEQLKDAYKCYRHRFQYHRKHIDNIRKKMIEEVSLPVTEGCARVKPWPKSNIIPNRHIADPLDFLLCKANPPPPLQHPNAQKLLENTPGVLFSPTKGLTLKERTDCISAARDAALAVSKRLGLTKIKENKMLLAAVTRATGLSVHALRELKGANSEPLIDPQVLASQMREDEELSDEENAELERLFSEEEEDEACDSLVVQFQKMSSGPLARLNRISVHPSRIHGRGLFALKTFSINSIIAEYCGELIRNWVCEARETRYRAKGVDCYMFRVDKDYVVDATFSGNAARFINHSCQPNCYARVLTVNERKHIVIMALRQILPGEELTYDYRFPKEDEKLPCHCGSQGCRGFLN